MSNLKSASLVVLAGMALSLGAGAAEKVDLGHKFAEGAEAAYTVTMKLETENSAAAAGASQKNTTVTDLSVRMKTAVESANVPAVLAVSFEEPRLDQTITGPSGELKVAVAGEAVTMKRGGNTIVDTAAGTGEDLAGTIRSELGFFGAVGRVSVDSRGRIVDVQGDAVIREVLSESTGPGLHCFVAPANPVGVGESWTVTTRISALRGIDMSATPIQVRTEYTLRSIEDGVAKVDVSSRLSERDVSARARLLKTAEQFVNIASIQRTATGSVEFDVASGRVLKSDLNVEFDATVELRIGEENVRQVSKGTAEISMSLER